MSVQIQANQVRHYDVTIDGLTHTVAATSNSHSRIVAQSEFGASKRSITSRLSDDEDRGVAMPRLRHPKQITRQINASKD